MKQRRMHLGAASMLALAVLAGSLALALAVPAMAASFAYVGIVGVPNIAVIDTNPASPTFNQVVATVANAPGADNLV